VQEFDHKPLLFRKKFGDPGCYADLKHYQELSLSNRPKMRFWTQKTISGIVQPSAGGAVSRSGVCPLLD
jgi:hypothetical protein